MALEDGETKITKVQEFKNFVQEQLNIAGKVRITISHYNQIMTRQFLEQHQTKTDKHNRLTLGELLSNNGLAVGLGSSLLELTYARIRGLEPSVPGMGGWGQAMAIDGEVCRMMEGRFVNQSNNTSLEVMKQTLALPFCEKRDKKSIK